MFDIHEDSPFEAQTPLWQSAATQLFRLHICFLEIITTTNNNNDNNDNNLTPIKKTPHLFFETYTLLIISFL